jgi:AraC-like DNA-binding protein
MLVPNQEEVRQWREEYARRLLQLDFEPIPDTAFFSSTQNIVDGMRIVKTTFSPGFTVRDDELVKRGDDSFAFLMSRSRNIEVDRKRQQFRLDQGDAVLMQVSEPGLLGAKTSFSYVAMMIPAAEMRSRLASMEDFRARISKSAEGLQLLRSYVQALETGKRVLGHHTQDAIQRHLFDLVAIACETNVKLGESSLSSVAAARLCAIQEFAGAHFEDPNFSVLAVATALGISPRYVQKLFQSMGRTFTGFVAELRLERAFAILCETPATRKRISDIALQVGFSDLSYFDRSFRRRYGTSPSDVQSAQSSDTLQLREAGIRVSLNLPLVRRSDIS